MSVIYDTFRKIEKSKIEMDRVEKTRLRAHGGNDPGGPLPRGNQKRSFKVLTVTSNKGGVGKTTISTNLAVYFRALREDLPILILGMDDQSQLDRMFSLDVDPPEHTVATGLRAGTFKNIIRLGQYGVHYVPSAMDASELKQEIRDPLCLLHALERTDWSGLVIVDTKSDLEILTRNAVAASDLLLVPVKNDTSLQEAKKVFSLLDEWSWPHERARIVLSMIDRRIKYRQAGDEIDILALLIQEIRKLGYPLLESFISGSPKVESLSTNPAGRVNSVLQGAAGSIVHRQLHHVASEALAILDEVSADTAIAVGPAEVPPPTAEEVEPDSEDDALTVAVAEPPRATPLSVIQVSPKPHISAVPDPAPAPAASESTDITPEESKDAFREARVLIDRWKRGSSARNPFSARSIWRRSRTFQIEKAKTGTK